MNQAWKAAHPERYRLAKARNRIRLMQLLWDFKAETPCADCGEADPRVLTFHHLNPTDKRYTIALMAARGLTWGTVQREIAKCVVVCANCHIKLHRGGRPALKPEHQPLPRSRPITRRHEPLPKESPDARIQRARHRPRPAVAVRPSGVR